MRCVNNPRVWLEQSAGEVRRDCATSVQVFLLLSLDGALGQQPSPLVERELL